MIRAMKTQTIQPFQLWELVGTQANDGIYGICEVLYRNNSTESPDSWVMRRLYDNKILYMHKRARERGEWIHVGFWRRLLWWLRDSGLAPFGFVEHGWHGRYQLLQVWGPFCPTRWEVRRWLGNKDEVDGRQWVIGSHPHGMTRFRRIEQWSEYVRACATAREALDVITFNKHRDRREWHETYQ